MAINRLNPDYPDAGSVQLIPTSVTVGSGSGSVDGNGAVTFSGVSSISFNDVFSSNYTNYKVIVNFDICSVETAVQLRLRVGGVDNSTASSYVAQELTVNSTTVSGSRATQSYLDQTLIMSDILTSSVELNIFNPFLTKPTGFNSFVQWNKTGSGNLLRLVTGSHNQSTSYTGFTFITQTGTATGTLRIYGYRN